MDIIDELEPVTRGPYTGCLGYLGFNRESQLNIIIRTAVLRGGRSHFHAGAGIVADSRRRELAGSQYTGPLVQHDDLIVTLWRRA
jgi:anthranilate/para-aminobenzoate synthase component I